MRTALTPSRTAGRALPPGEHALGLSFEGRVLGLFVLAFSVAALLLGEDLVFLVGAVSLATIFGTRRLARRNLRGVEVTRVVPARGRVGVAARLEYEIRNAGRTTAIGLTVEDRMPPGARPQGLRVSVAPLPPGGRVVGTVPVEPTRRGRVHVTPPLVHSRWPLGLYRAEHRALEGGEILVRPREGRPTPRLRDLLRGRLHADHRPSARLVGDDVFHGVREYREGDDPRRIHWRTTARLGSLAVAEWHREEGREVVVILGRGAGVGPSAAGDFERAVSVSATVLRAAAQHGLRARLYLGRTGDRVDTRSRAMLGADLDALAEVRPQGGRRPRAALRLLGRRSGHRVVVYVATGPEPGVERRLDEAAGREGTGLFLRADQPVVRRYVRGLP